MYICFDCPYSYWLFLICLFRCIYISLLSIHRFSFDFEQCYWISASAATFTFSNEVIQNICPISIVHRAWSDSQDNNSGRIASRRVYLFYTIVTSDSCLVLCEMRGLAAIALLYHHPKNVCFWYIAAVIYIPQEKLMCSVVYFFRKNIKSWNWNEHRSSNRWNAEELQRPQFTCKLQLDLRSYLVTYLRRLSIDGE